MNRVTAASIAFLLFAVGLSAWLLTRPRAPVDVAESASPSGADSPTGLTFAEWSVRNDGVLLADIDPGARGAASTTPRRFLYLATTRAHDGTIAVSEGRSFSWAAADRKESAEALFALGFRINTDGRAFVPPDDPLWSDPVRGVDGGAEQTVTLRAKGGTTAHLERRRADPRSIAYWNRRAIGFASPDGRMVYITPDAIVISADPR